MKLLALPILSFLALLASCNFSDNISPDKNDANQRNSKYSKYDSESWIKKNQNSKIKGWDYVGETLIESGIPKAKVLKILSDPNLAPWTPIPFKVKPQESKAMYASLNTPRTRENALKFFKENKQHFKSAENTYNVPAEYILSILQVETSCGQNTGDERIFYWLARLTSTGFPPNLDFNLKNSEEEPKPTLKELEERSAWLEEEFTPHLISLIEFSDTLGISPLEVRGSKGGALGLPQFLPKNISKYGVDGDKNGAVNIFTPPDAIHSIANFLVSHGWVDSNNKSNVIDTILHYNRSTAYANTVYNMASDLREFTK